jgi:hypothetical protein
MTVKSIDFEQLLWPGHPDDFMRNYFQKHLYVLRRDDPHFYDGLISLADVESLAFSTKTPESYNQRWLDINKVGNPPLLAGELFNERGIIPTKVITYYQQGYTIVLNRLQQHWPSIALLCKNLEESLSSYTQPLPFGLTHASIFLTPPDAQGFLPHYDEVDVFILQLEGSKHWNIYNQVAGFPFEESPKLSIELLGKPVQALCLNPGDMLYMPAGYPHEASSNKGYSMHLTVGIIPYKQQQVINDLTIIDEQESLVAALRLKSSYLVNQLLLADDYLHQINHLHEITPETRLCKRHGQTYQIVRTTTQLSLQFPGNAITLPREVDPALRFIINNDKFAVHSIPEMEHDEATFALVRRLIGSGFLKTVP